MRLVFLFAPGAGAPSSHPWMQRWREHLATLGAVHTFDYDYLRAGRRRPDRLPELIAAHRAALESVRAAEPDGAIVLVGKSMGGRIGCHLALEEKVAGLVCLGYPLCAMSDRRKLRDQVLRSLGTPVLFVQGTRDPLCPLDLLEPVRQAMSAPNELLVIAGGDHSLLLRKRELQANGERQENVDARILAGIRRFLETFVRRDESADR